jgi:glycosyltransferase involved in cell wall biosynthesis
MKKERKIIYAAGLHTGGGLFVLNYLRNKISTDGDIFFLDERLKIDKFYNKYKYFIVKKNFFSKFYSELKIKLLHDTKKNKIIFLNGLPPFFNYKNLVISYFQNANILYYKHLFSFDFLRSIKFKIFKNNVDIWKVFSKNTKKKLSEHFSNKKIIYQKIIIKKFKSNLKKKYDFIYPASGETHKNHKKLIEAFIIISKKNIFPSLLLTLGKLEYKKLKIDHYKKKFKLKIINKKNYNRKKFLNNYLRSKALIFPSFTETLGLPLLEAQSYGLDILASDRDFSKHYTKKNKLFDPDNSQDIADKIIKYYHNSK